MLIWKRLSHAQSTSSIASGVSLLNSSLSTTTTASTELLGHYHVSLTRDRNLAVKPSNRRQPMCSMQRMTRYSRKTPSEAFFYQTRSTRQIWAQDSSTVLYSEANTSETIFVFIPSFFSRCVELRLRKDYGIVTPSLTAYPILKGARKPPVMWACRIGDLEALEKAFSTPGVSPFMVDTDGNSLLHAKACLYSSNCRPTT